MHADPQLKRHIIDPLALPPVVSHVALGVVLCLIVVCSVFWRTTLSMIAVWERSETFAHGFTVVPIFLYLLWGKRAQLAAASPRPFLPALIGLACAGALWLVGEISVTLGMTQFAMMAMVPFAVWALFGTAVLRSLAFPLAFLFFAVPFGEALVPKLMDWTADFLVLGLRLSGVPVWRETNFIAIPSGRWSVVEACSGLRYLIASMMVGWLFAYLNYRGTRKRVLFILVSIVVPIVANWLRAYFIVMLGHLTNNRLATGIDHIIYGWIFFGVVMAVLFAIGMRWTDNGKAPLERESIVAFHPETNAGAAQRSLAATAIAAIVVIGVWPLALSALTHPMDRAQPVLAEIAGANGWSQGAAPITRWEPQLAPPSATVSQTFEKNGMRAGLHVSFYRDQTSESKAISSQNSLSRTTNRTWRLLRGIPASIDTGHGRLDVDSAIVEGLGQRLAVWRWYWIDGQWTASDTFAKLLQVSSILRGHGDAIAWVIVYTPLGRDENSGDSVLTDFATALIPHINARLAEAARD